MQKNIEIRMATVDDLPAIERAGNQLFDHQIKKNRAVEFFNDVRHHLALAFHKDEAVGMASGFHYVHPDKDPALFVNEVGVMEAYQNQGIGRKLVMYLCEHVRKIGCTEAWVGTEESNIAARKAYLAAGGTPDSEPFILFEFNLRKSNLKS
ncbi:MAG: GNAT family N-acetyltransferase [Aurantibacter sp.]